jgi:biopolymer transport protein ExbB
MAQAPAKQANKGFDFSILVVPIALLMGYLIWQYFCGHYVDAKGEPLKNADNSQNLFGLVYKGGFIVPILIGMMITVISYSIERALTIGKAKGTGSIEAFLQQIKGKLASNDINGALADCAKQKGSVANVVQAGLHKYNEMDKDNTLEGEKKVLAIQQEIEEATSLELPMLQKNLVFLSTIASVGTLVALLGTVIGMIKSFAALATTGSPDPTKLSAGISEALVNTAIGIATSATAIILYNVFTSQIDSLTYAIDEIGFSIAQSFASRKK